MKQMKTIRNILYIAGILLFLSIIAYSLYHTNCLWINEFKSDSFDSFAEYFFTRAKGEILLAVIAGVIPVSVGAFIGLKRDTKNI